MNWKKVLLSVVLGVVVIFGAIFAYMVLTTRNHSPADTATYSSGGLTATVDYCRPYKKGRVIFGTQDEGALQPYGKYWRVGANEATELELSKDVTVMGSTLEAGRYVIYAIPDKSEWTVGFNTDLGRWGYSEVDYEKDVLQVKVPSMALDEPIEQFTIDFASQGEDIIMNLKWDNTLVPISIRPI